MDAYPCTLQPNVKEKQTDPNQEFSCRDAMIRDSYVNIYEPAIVNLW